MEAKVRMTLVQITQAHTKEKVNTLIFELKERINIKCSTLNSSKNALKWYFSLFISNF